MFSSRKYSIMISVGKRLLYCGWWTTRKQVLDFLYFRYLESTIDNSLWICYKSIFFLRLYSRGAHAEYGECQIYTIMYKKKKSLIKWTIFVNIHKQHPLFKKKSVVIHNTNWQDQINSYYLTTISNARHMRSPVTF